MYRKKRLGEILGHVSQIVVWGSGRVGFALSRLDVTGFIALFSPGLAFSREIRNVRPNDDHHKLGFAELTKVPLTGRQLIVLKADSADNPSPPKKKKKNKPHPR